MNWIDFVILALLGGGFFWSFRHGFIMEVIYFVAAMIGLLVAFVFYPFVKPVIQLAISNSGGASAVSFFLTFVFGAGLVTVFGILFHKFIYMIHLGIFDRLLGGLFGLIKVAMIISVCLVMFVGMKGSDTPEYIQNSAIGMPVVDATTTVMKSVPPLFETFHDDYGQRALKWLKKSRESLQ
jgi:membrane protein required for colicin V production